MAYARRLPQRCPMDGERTTNAGPHTRDRRAYAIRPYNPLSAQRILIGQGCIAMRLPFATNTSTMRRVVAGAATHVAQALRRREDAPPNGLAPFTHCRSLRTRLLWHGRLLHRLLPMAYRERPTVHLWRRYVRLTASRNRERTALKRRRIDGHGQSMVEFALVIPVFLLLLFGTLEVGMAYKTHSAFQESTLEAVRVASAESTTDTADQHALDQLVTMLAGENLNNISSVTIYRANDNTYVPPLNDPPGRSACNAVGATSPCYDSIHTNYIYKSGKFVCADASQEIPPQPCTSESFWSPANRKNTIPTNSTDAPLDIIGVRIIYKYRGVTGLLFPVTITQVATAQIEPTGFGS